MTSFVPTLTTTTTLKFKKIKVERIQYKQNGYLNNINK